MFLQSLRDIVSKGISAQLQQQDHSVTDDILKAYYIVFETPLKLEDQSGYKHYDAWSILFFYHNRQLDHPSYLKTCAELGPKGANSISFMDRRELLDYLTGASSTINNTTFGQTSTIEDLKPQAAEIALFGFNLAEKRAAITDEMRADLEEMKRIKLFHRTINTTSNVLTVKGTKNFGNVEKPAFAAFMGIRDLKKQSAKKLPPKKTKEVKKESKVPIIIVPAAAQSLLTLYNAKEFLIDQKFVSTEEVRSKGDTKPLQVLITRDPKKLSPMAQSKFLVLDATDTLTPQDWSRVVAVFATGQDWQFKGWKWEKPVDIFSHVMGYSLRFQDEPVAGCLSQWKVKQLQINRNKRYLDSLVVHNFWQEVDQHMAIKQRLL